MGNRIALLAIVLSATSLSSYAAMAEAQKPKQQKQAVKAEAGHKAPSAPKGDNNMAVLKKQLEEQQAKIENQEKQIKAQLDRVIRQQQQLEEQKADIAKLQAVFAAASGEKVAPRKEVEAEPEERKAKGEKQIGTDYKPESADRAPEVTTLTDVGGVLTPKGQLIFEPTVEYTNSSAVRVALEGYTIIPALNIGLFDVNRVNRDMFVTSVGARYGVTNRIEIDGKIPYVYRDDSTFSRPVGIGAAQDTLTNVSGDGVGDVEVGAHYQINTGQNGWPFLIANVRFKSTTGTSPYDIVVDPNTGLQEELPTGSGFFALQPSVTAIYPADPAVFYANLGYLFNMEEDVGGTLGTIDPGDSINLSMGMGLSLNDKSSFSIGYSHDVVMAPTQNGATIPLTDTLQVGVLDVGYSYRLNPKTSINLGVGAGLTEDSPDVRLTLKVPYKFGVKDKKKK